MNVSISTGLYYTKDYRNILDIIQQAGCDHIELMLNQSFLDVTPHAIMDEVQARKLTVETIHAPFAFINPHGWTEVQSIDYCIQLAKELHVPTIVTHDMFDFNEDGQFILHEQRHLHAMCRYKDCPITIVTENMPRMPLPSMMSDMSAFHQYLDTQDLYMTLDTTHAGSTGDDLLEVYQNMKHRIRNIHISDYHDGIEHMMIDTGCLPLASFVQQLVQEEYPYPLTIEYDFDNPQRNTIRNDHHAVDLLRRSLDLLAKYAQ